MTRIAPLRLIPLALAFAACGPGSGLSDTPSSVAYVPATVDGEVPEGFSEAISSETVPLEVLLGIANAETGFQMVVGEVEFEGQEPAFGLMGLRESNLMLAADLAGLDPEDVKTDPNANIMAAATLLAEWASEAGIDTTDLASWAPIVARYSGIETDEGQREYVHYEVYRTIQEGVRMEGFELQSANIEPAFPFPSRHGDRLGQSGTIWTGSPNNSSRGGRDAEFVIIHTCEGGYSGCWSWLSNSASGVSAHYVVNASGSEVRQLVDEDRKAWHISANYSCSRNSNQECGLNGSAMNSISVGIEHAGFSSQSSWSSGLIERSADLTCGITERHDIPRDRYHVVGHGQLQPWNRTDPGPNWPWSTYMDEVDAACGAAPPPPAPAPDPDPVDPDPVDPDPDPTPAPSTGVITIDSNNFANDLATHYIDVSSSWTPSANVSGFFNTGYWYAPTGSISDPAEFRFVSGGDGCYEVEAWWTAASDRATTTFIGWNSAEAEVGRQTVDQRADGGRWNSMGHWQFSPGWNKVLLSRWTGSGGFAIADAVRLTPSTQCF